MDRHKAGFIVLSLGVLFLKELLLRVFYGECRCFLYLIVEDLLLYIEAILASPLMCKV